MLKKSIVPVAASLCVLLAATTASAQHGHSSFYGNQFYGGQPPLPIHQVHNLSQQLIYELRLFAADAHRHLAGSRHYDHLCGDIRDAQRELADLDQAIHEAARRPDRWDRVARRARDVEKDICDVVDELDDALSDRRFFAPPGGPIGHEFVPFNRQIIPQQRSGLGIALQFGGGKPSIRLVNNQPLQHQFSGNRHYVGRPVVPVDPCDQLRSQAATLHNLASQLVSLTAAHCH